MKRQNSFAFFLPYRLFRDRSIGGDSGLPRGTVATPATLRGLAVAADVTTGVGIVVAPAMLEGLAVAAPETVGAEIVVLPSTELAETV